MGTPDPPSTDDRAISAPKYDRPARRSEVDALITECRPGMSIRAIERETGLSEGALGHHLKKGQRGKVPALAIMERFARALGTSLERVSKAFAADSYIPVGVDLPPDEEDLINFYRQLSPAGKRLLLCQVAVQVQCEHEEQRAARKPGRTLPPSPDTVA